MHQKILLYYILQTPLDRPKRNLPSVQSVAAIRLLGCTNVVRFVRSLQLRHDAVVRFASILRVNLLALLPLQVAVFQLRELVETVQTFILETIVFQVVFKDRVLLAYSRLLHFVLVVLEFKT